MAASWQSLRTALAVALVPGLSARVSSAISTPGFPAKAGSNCASRWVASASVVVLATGSSTTSWTGQAVGGCPEFRGTSVAAPGDHQATI
jgi:hypothetical protein